MPALRIFISYSRIDKELVTPIAAVLRLSATVFRDEDSIAPGKRWASEIASSLEESDAVIVFWSLAASESKYVESEYSRAIFLSKDVVPVLLDDTPLANPLTEFQWIDFRSFVKAAAMRSAHSIAAVTVGLIASHIVLANVIERATEYVIKKYYTKGLPYKFDEKESSEMLKAINKRLNAIDFSEG